MGFTVTESRQIERIRERVEEAERYGWSTYDEEARDDVRYLLGVIDSFSGAMGKYVKLRAKPVGSWLPIKRG